MVQLVVNVVTVFVLQILEIKPALPDQPLAHFGHVVEQVGFECLAGEHHFVLEVIRRLGVFPVHVVVQLHRVDADARWFECAVGVHLLGHLVPHFALRRPVVLIHSAVVQYTH